MFACLCHQRLHHPRGGGRVQVAGGLVGQQQVGAVHQGAGNRHPLQLSARELLRQTCAQAFEPDGLQHGLHPRVVVLAQQQQRQGDVLRDIQMRQDVEGLKHKADPGAAQQGALVVPIVPRSSPARLTVPVSQLSSPAMQLSRVDLPTPDSPTIATNSPAATCSETCWNTATWP